MSDYDNDDIKALDKMDMTEYDKLIYLRLTCKINGLQFKALSGYLDSKRAYKIVDRQTNNDMLNSYGVSTSYTIESAYKLQLMTGFINNLK